MINQVTGMELKIDRVLNGHCPICDAKLYSHVTDDLRVIPGNIPVKRVILDGLAVEVCAVHPTPKGGSEA